jgi:hypothetical protein
MGETRRNKISRIDNIREALVTSGYTSLDQQAKALGIHRSTTWTIIKNKHKLGRLSAKTTSRILANPETPPSVRAVVLRYLSERGESRPENQQHHSRPASDRTRVQESRTRTS